DKIHWPKEFSLAAVDAAVAKDRIRHRNVEVDVRNRYLKQIILAADDLPGNPRKADFAAFCAFVFVLRVRFRRNRRFSECERAALRGFAHCLRASEASAPKARR